MARQLDVASRSLRRAVLLRQRWPSHGHIRRVFSSVSSLHPSNCEASTRSSSSTTKHQSFVTSVPTLQALQHVQRLLQQPQRRVLLLTGSSVSESATRVALERDSSVFELERRGHGLFGVREFCQLLLRESGRERRVFGRAQLAALLLHGGLEVPGASRLAATSTLQRRKGVQGLLQLFRLLEREGVTPEQYKTIAVAGGEQVPQELADKYAAYQELLLQHNATSWDGLVMDGLDMCGVQKAAEVQDAVAKHFSETAGREYTDVVLDDVQKMTPAMARLVGHLVAQPSVQSSASFSRVLLEGDECPQTRILERQLMETAASTGRNHNVSRVVLNDGGGGLEMRAKMQTFAQRVLTRRAVVRDDVVSPVPLQCWRFGVPEAEERSIGAYLADRLKREGNTQVTVLCPSNADAHRITMAFKKQGLPIQMSRDRFSGATSSSGTPVHLFDEPGVNPVYSLLCALCFPSDSRHLYNVLRSDYFGFPAELLSWLMEKEHRSHADMFSVIEAFVENRGKYLRTSLHQNEHELQELPPAVSAQLDTGLEIAESFVKIIKCLRADCHTLSTAEIVQKFLEDTGRLQSLLSPNSSEQDRESLVLADFLRELETAQNVVKSAQVVFVAPYLQQLRETNLSSSASWDEVSPDMDGTESGTPAEEGGIRVLPLTSYSLESLASSVTNQEEGSVHVLVLMSMRDSKFPGRMKRLTLPLPYNLLSEPFPIQTRTEHLEECEQLAYKALTLGIYDEVVLSFAELAATSSSKREMLSRTFEPIWHEGDRPATGSKGKGGTEMKGGSSNASPLREVLPSRLTMASPAPQHKSTAQVPKAPRFWLLEMVDFMRSFVSRVFVPVLHHEKRSVVADVPTHKENDGNGQAGLEQQDQVITIERRLEAATLSSPRLPAKKILYDPTHLSYSQISEYLRCPHRYYLSRVMKLVGEVSTSMMFGRALHEGVASFAKSLATSQRNGELTKEAKALAAVEGEEAFMRAWAGDGYGLFSSEEQATFLLERGMKALQDFIENHHGDLNLKEILRVEQEFSFHVPEANVELRGVWDRIDRVSRVGDDEFSSFVIKEFKSNMGGAERNMRKLAEESLQLKMYMYAFRKVFGEAPYGAKLQQIGGNYHEPSSDPIEEKRKRTTRAGNDNGFVHFTEKAAQEAEDTIVEVASGLRRGDFEPKPSFAECAFCPFAGSACHFASDDASYERQTARKATAHSAA